MTCKDRQDNIFFFCDHRRLLSTPTLTLTFNNSFFSHSIAKWSKWCSNDVQMMFKWCPNDVQMMFKWSKWCSNDVQMMYKWCTNNVQMMFKWCPNDVQIITWTWTFIISVIKRDGLQTSQILTLNINVKITSFMLDVYSSYRGGFHIFFTRGSTCRSVPDYNKTNWNTTFLYYDVAMYLTIQLQQAAYSFIISSYYQ